MNTLFRHLVRNDVISTTNSDDFLPRNRMPTNEITLSELRYRRIFEAAHDGILLVDPDTRKIVDVKSLFGRFGAVWNKK